MSELTTFDLSAQQDEALGQVRAWLGGRGGQIFRLFGYAGTGKTTMARLLSEDVRGEVRFAAYTGKAASVMRARGCAGATTLHRLIYNPGDKSKARLRELQEELSELPPEERAGSRAAEKIRHKIREEEERLRQPAFSLNPDSELRRAKLLVVDEGSMVDQRLGTDVLSFGVPVLVLGDPAQLPPIKGGGFFTGGAPDYLLTEIHRQAEGSPIIELATRVRQGDGIPLGRYGDSLVTDERPTPEQVRRHDQVLVGKNATRRACNARYRKLLGYEKWQPQPGDRLVCLRNNHDVGLLNGTLWDVAAVGEFEDGFDQLMLDLRGEDGQQVSTFAYTHHFRGQELPWFERDADEFDYGYAMTVHKAQGSQWSSVMVFDESWVFRNTSRNWLYTAITRAAERVTIVRR